ncbi:hypothetical protein [Thaumasiovibrio subtropicus]|uniref:hypothetical protein n=1 Tax=Thaumasiovibrio subtropicus TaxID=1891207 RepID=UPI000B35BC54|nr:hypothetical protein [Thaumasiovibrio subtropicus]
MSRLTLVACSLAAVFAVNAADFQGQVNFEHRQFFSEGQQGQDKAQSSVVLMPEIYHAWDDYSVTFELFARLDSLDSERSHWDVRELMVQYYANDVELNIGIGKVFWGVTESQHLVDVINQTDWVESVDGEQKLGQPMINLNWFTDCGNFQAYVLPGFRERTFAGRDGRLGPYGINTDNAKYEASNEDQHVDVAFRYTQMLGDWDIGLSIFHGTNRDPYLQIENSELVPYYAQMTQIGADLQGIYGDWIYKLEAIHRDSNDETFRAMTAGFEYTQVGIFDSQYDLGWLAEYLYDSRDEEAPVSGQNDIFAGWRLALNDADSSEILFGISQDLDFSRSRSARLEATSRLSNNWKWRVNAWLFESDDAADSLYGFRDEDFVELALDYYF